MDRRRFLCLAAGACVLPNARASADAVERRLRFTLRFTNPLDRPLDGQLFWGYVPAHVAPGQRLQELRVSVPHTVQGDSLGHRIVMLSFDRFPPLGQKIVTMEAQVELRAEADAGSPALDLPDRAEWLRPERYIEIDAADIRALAAQLRQPTDLATARAIYEWVRDNLHYAGYLADDLGALYAVRNRRGDCTEYADLVVALARANGIPARMAGGYVVERDATPQVQDYHNWAQLYLDGAWRTVDAQKGNWLGPPAQYVLFRIYRDTPINAVGLAHRYRIDGELKVNF